jgi:hypothetical protein
MGRKRTRDQAVQQHAAQEQAAQQPVLRFVVRDTRGGFRIIFEPEGVVRAIASPNAWDVFAAVAAMLNPEWTTKDLFRHYQVTL